MLHMELVRLLGLTEGANNVALGVNAAYNMSNITNNISIGKDAGTEQASG